MQSKSEPNEMSSIHSDDSTSKPKQVRFPSRRFHFFPGNVWIGKGTSFYKLTRVAGHASGHNGFNAEIWAHALGHSITREKINSREAGACKNDPLSWCEPGIIPEVRVMISDKWPWSEIQEASFQEIQANFLVRQLTFSQTLRGISKRLFPNCIWKC